MRNGMGMSRLRWSLIAACVLIFAATPVLWLWSYSATGAMEFAASPASPRLAIGCTQGDMFVELRYSNLPALVPVSTSAGISTVIERPARPVTRFLRGPMQTHFRFIGFAAGSYTLDSSPGQAGRIDIFWPCWFQMLVIAAFPLWCFWRRRARTPEGYCRRCGYDLRATPHRCPECGTKVHQTRIGIAAHSPLLTA